MAWRPCLLGNFLGRPADPAMKTITQSRNRNAARSPRLGVMVVDQIIAEERAAAFNKFDPTSPFGGYKESGFGREGGVHGLLPYLSLN
jgi:acyl-CoA reductase-like NAD-dependent aldehyde dehydrogenase